jgi:hypothetical protein
MSKIVKLKKRSLKFPPVCLVCGAYANRFISIEKLFLYRGFFGRPFDSSRSIAIHLTVPVCGLHYQVFIEETPLEHFLNSRSMLLAIIFGLLGAFVVLWSAQAMSNEAIFFGIFLALLVGVGIFNFIRIFSTHFAAEFASPESKEIRKFIRLISYSKKSDLLKMEFKDEYIARLVARENKQRAR